MDSLNIPTSWGNRRERLLTSMKKYAKSGKDLPFFIQENHQIVTPVLRSLAFDLDLRGAKIFLKFSDQSVLHTPFECGVLANRKKPSFEELFPVKLGAMSQRHLDLDFIVSGSGGYIIENRVLSGRGDASYVAALSYECAKKFFTSECMSAEPCHFELFQTGFLPMMIGIYQGYMDALLLNSGSGATSRFLLTPRVLLPSIDLMHGEEPNLSAASQENSVTDELFSDQEGIDEDIESFNDLFIGNFYFQTDYGAQEQHYSKEKSWF